MAGQFNFFCCAGNTTLFSGMNRMDPTTIKYVFPTGLNSIIDYSKVKLPTPDGITIDDIIKHGSIKIKYGKPTK